VQADGIPCELLSFNEAHESLEPRGISDWTSERDPGLISFVYVGALRRPEYMSSMHLSSMTIYHEDY